MPNKNNNKIIYIPDKSEFVNFGLSILKDNDFTFSLEAKYDSWVAMQWKTGGGRKIKDWKATLKNLVSF